MPKKYQLDPAKQAAFTQLAVLEYVINGSGSLPVYLEGDNAYLDEIVTKLFQADCLRIDGSRYLPTELGQKKLGQFMHRYSEFLNTMDVYHSVDLSKGEFAMARFYEMEAAQWEVFLADERWEDLRIAVAEFKKIDPLEIVFMSFLNEGRIDTAKPGWQFELAMGSCWGEMVEICDNALQVDDLAYTDPNGNQISGQDVIRDVIAQGTQVLLDLFNYEKQNGINQEGRQPSPGGQTTETVEIIQPVSAVYFQPYFNPLYVAPIWWDPYW